MTHESVSCPRISQRELNALSLDGLAEEVFRVFGKLIDHMTMSTRQNPTQVASGLR
jgi:hypothetical protein